MWKRIRNKFRGTPEPRVIEPGVGGPDPILLQWTRQRMPDPGAEAYSFDILDLQLQSLIDHGVAVRTPWKPMERGPQPYFPVQHTALQGIGQVSGGIVSQPLFNPKLPGYSGISYRRMNDPFPRAEILPAGRVLT